MASHVVVTLTWMWNMARISVAIRANVHRRSRL
jgi:hypothetical protein